MSERLPLPTKLLRGPARGPSIDGQANGVAHRLLDLADRGDYLDAAAEAAELLRGGACDMRLVAVYLAGSFVERGAAALPDILGCVDVLLGEDPGASRLVDSAMAWLFRALADRVAFHTTQRDETWKAWIQAITPEQIEEISRHSIKILAKSPGGAGTLQKIAHWARDKLGPAAARVAKLEPVTAEVTSGPAMDPMPVDARPGWDQPDDELDIPDIDAAQGEPEFGPQPTFEPESEFEPDPDEYDEYDDPEDPHDPHEFGFNPPREFHDSRQLAAPRIAGPHPTATVEVNSPALAQLQDKLRGFEILLERGELDKAAVVARDIQAVLEDFDPLVYLPSLFARYLQLLNGTLGEIEARWAADDTTAWRVLVQFYRADLDGFVDD